MSLPEITMPDPPPEPEIQKEEEPAEGTCGVRSESVNYDDSAPTVTFSKVDEVIDELLNTSEPPPPEDDDTPRPEPLRVKPIIEDEEVFKDVPPKKPRKKSQKQMDHLAKAREKALAVRQANAKAKREAKAESEFTHQATRQDPRPQEQKESVILHMSVAEFQKMTEESNSKAVEKYDTKRKAQKKAKKDAQEEYRKANQVNHQINKALGVADPDDFFASCFQ